MNLNFQRGPYQLAAKDMLSYSDIVATQAEEDKLAFDLVSVAAEFDISDDTDEQEATHAVHILVNRIGGYKNLRSYINCLMAGK